MADNKTKTKASILQELESIKGLLLEEDDIPILQEVITTDASDEMTSLTSLGQAELDNLHEALQTISHTIEEAHETERQAYDATNDAETQQKSLFDQDHLDVTATTATTETTDNTGEDYSPQNISETDTFQIQETRTANADYAAPASTSTIGFGGSKPSFQTGSGTQVTRPNMTKASGENPFLPQHIRARLHGNNPPPLFDFGNSSQVAESATSAAMATAAHRPHNRQQLIRDLIATVLPQVERELRLRLQALTEEELQKLLEQDE